MPSFFKFYLLFGKKKVTKKKVLGGFAPQAPQGYAFVPKATPIMVVVEGGASPRCTFRKSTTKGGGYHPPTPPSCLSVNKFTSKFAQSVLRSLRSLRTSIALLYGGGVFSEAERGLRPPPFLLSFRSARNKSFKI